MGQKHINYSSRLYDEDEVNCSENLHRQPPITFTVANARAFPERKQEFTDCFKILFEKMSHEYRVKMVGTLSLLMKVRYDDWIIDYIKEKDYFKYSDIANLDNRPNQP